MEYVLIGFGTVVLNPLWWILLAVFLLVRKAVKKREEERQAILEIRDALTRKEERCVDTIPSVL